MSTPEQLGSLNAPQRRAVTFGEPLPGGKGFRAGPLLIVAGAGTGKTNTLAHRVAHLAMSGVDPARILMLTFTRRAAQEMKRRANEIMREAFNDKLGSKASQISQRLTWAGTFHSIGNRLLRHYAKHVGLDPTFTVIDRGDAADLVDTVRTELGYSGKGQRFPRKDTCLGVYSYRVNTQKSLKETLESQYAWCSNWEEDIAKLLRTYVERKAQYRVLDFDDLLLYWHAMMSEEKIAKSVAAHFDHVLVDEYQDTNKLQNDILHALKPDGQGVTVVGDDAQAIYSFRAAAVENILGFPGPLPPQGGDHHAGAELPLQPERPRRRQRADGGCAAPASQAPALDARPGPAAQAGDGGRPADPGRIHLHARAGFARSGYPAAAPGGVVPHRLAQRHAGSRAGETQDSVREVRRPQVPRGRARQGPARGTALGRQSAQPPGRVPRAAVHAGHGTGECQARAGSLHREQLRVGRRSRNSNRRMTRACTGRNSSSCSRRCAEPNREWRGQIALVREWYKPHMERMYEHVHMRIGDLDQLELLSSQYQTRERFVTELTLDPPNATGDLSGQPIHDEDYLVISTIHSAKGMEWDNVYILNVVEGSFPNEFSTGKAEAIEEERRLLYVAMTRARNELSCVVPLRFQVTSQPKTSDGHVYGARSRFLTEKVVKCFDEQTFQGSNIDMKMEEAVADSGTIDVASKLKQMW